MISQDNGVESLQLYLLTSPLEFCIKILRGYYWLCIRDCSFYLARHSCWSRPICLLIDLVRLPFLVVSDENLSGTDVPPTLLLSSEACLPTILCSTSPSSTMSMNTPSSSNRSSLSRANLPLPPPHRLQVALSLNQRTQLLARGSGSCWCFLSMP